MTLRELFESGRDSVTKLKDWFDFKIGNSKFFIGRENPKCNVCLHDDGEPHLIVRSTTKDVLYEGMLCKRCAENMLKIYKDAELV